MAHIEILHLSDLHWHPKNPTDPQIVIDALIRDLEGQISRGEIAPDLLIFSGDLVLSGETQGDFEPAYARLITPALSAVGLTPDQLLITPGNHDVARAIVRDTPFIEQGMKGALKSVDSVNAFVDKLNGGDFNSLLGIQRMENYYSFVKSKIAFDSSSTEIMKTKTFDIRGMSVGAACFDTAWRATGEADDVDRGNLLLGERNVDNAIAALANADISIAVLHHPLDWLADFDEIAVSSRISANFDIMLCGHTHRPVPQTRTTAQGTAILSQTGSVYAGRRWFNGFQTVRLSLDDASCEFIVRSYYDTPRREFDAATNVMANGRVTFPFEPQKKSSDNALVEAFLRDARAGIRQSASEHLNMLGIDLISSSDVKEAFVVPPLTSKSVVDEEAEDDDSELVEAQRDDITIEELLRSSESYLIIGGRESGKTSILHYMAVLCAEGVSDVPRIPVVMNASTIRAGDYELKRAITSYFGLTPKKSDLDILLKAGQFLFLVDNYVEDHKSADVISKHIKDHSVSRWILITKPRDGSVTGDIKAPETDPKMITVRLGSLPRRSIRTLSKRWSEAIGSGEEEVFEAVMKQLKKDGLPRTGYMVTLILWAMKQEKELDRVNEAMLLSNVIDHLLGKADFTQSVRGRLDPRAKELTLEYFAVHLAGEGSYISVDAAVAYLAELFRNRRLPFVAVDVLNEAVKCGILDRTDNTITFKYSSFQEYFFALRMKSDGNLFKEVIYNQTYLLRSREIEMLSGLRRENTDIIETVHSDMHLREPLEFRNLTKDAIEGVVDASLGLEVSKRQLGELRRKRLSADQVDDILDVADRRATADRAKANEREDAGGSEDSAKATAIADDNIPDVMGIAEYLQAADLLARVVRNSDFSDFEVKAPAVLTVLHTGSKVCALMRGEVSKIMSEPFHKDGVLPLDEQEKRVLLYFITKVIASTVSQHVIDILAAPNIAPMMDEIIENPELLVVERVFAAFLLQSVRSPKWEERWSELLREKGVSGFVVEMVISRMRAIVDTQFLDDKEHRKLHTVIDTAEEVLGWTNEQKGDVITDLRKVRTQADMRDLI